MSSAGFVNPSPVQWTALPLANLGVDLVVQAKSGTGKTLVFVLSALNMVKVDLNTVQVILITPTREIAVQGARALLDVAKEYQDLRVHTFIGKTLIFSTFENTRVKPPSAAARPSGT